MRNFRKAFIVSSRSEMACLKIGSLDPFAISYGEKTSCYNMKAVAEFLRIQLRSCAASDQRTSQSPLRRRRVRRDRDRRTIRDGGRHAWITNRRGRRAGRGNRRRPAKPIAAATTSTAEGESKKRCEKQHPLHCLCLLTGEAYPLTHLRRARHRGSVLARSSRGAAKNWPLNPTRCPTMCKRNR
jgi:hypothetical protein